MSKASNPRRQAENEAKATTRMLRVSPQKLNLLAQLIRGKKVATALADLEFSRKRISVEVKKTLESAIANAENNHDLDVDDLIVAQAWVGKDLVLKRFSPRARGRAGRIEKPFANITIVVREVAADAKAAERICDGTEDQSDRAAPRRQPHLGLALVFQQGRVRQALA